ncbi:MAG: AarF/UbiB family protein [Thermoanaerobaculia bacterium]|nr:AarF/UbiB family protein [Thermoanaerobaculia bacterium]
MLKLPVRGEHLKRYREIASLLLRYGSSDLVRKAGLGDLLDGELTEEASLRSRAEDLARDLERMGPTFVKLGQLLSSRADLLPEPYLEALSRLQDRVEPFPYAEVEKIVARELGVRISRAFGEFERTPMAAASLAQVHRASLRDGTSVAVKVQRPGIRREIDRDLEIFDQIVGVLSGHTEVGRTYDLEGLARELRRTLNRELDYLREANHLRRLESNLEEFERLVVPTPIEDYTTSRVLTMELVRGTKIDKLSPLVRLEIPGQELADELFRAYLRQILVDGFFHADPHPGNVFLTRDHRIALIDLGMVGHVSPELQEQLLKLLVAVSSGKGEEAAEMALRLSPSEAEVDRGRFRREIAELVAEYQERKLESIEVGKVVLGLGRVAARNGVRLPGEISLLGKALLSLDQVGRILDPEFDPNAAIRRHASELMRRRMWSTVSPGGVLGGILETVEFFERLPSRVNRILELVADNELRLNLTGVDFSHLVVGLQKVANRITAGLVIAAFIVGAALMMRVQTEFTLFGYPGVAMIFFLAAAVGGLWLIFDILYHDRA